MQYMGGKSAIARYIAPIIAASGESHCLVSLFCGAVSVESILAQHFDEVLLNDKNSYLVALLQAIQRGWVPPDSITKAEYAAIKADKDKNPALAGFAGFACSYMGKWFGTYFATDGGKTNPAARGKKSILRKMETLKKAKIVCKDYRDVIIPDGAVIYADPPYRGTTGYSAVKDKFDSVSFWLYMRKLAIMGHDVYVSELDAPEWAECVWQKEMYVASSALRKTKTKKRKSYTN